MNYQHRHLTSYRQSIPTNKAIKLRLHEYDSVIPIESLRFYKFKTKGTMYYMVNHAPIEIVFDLHEYMKGLSLYNRADILEGLFGNRQLARHLSIISTLPEEFVNDELKWLHSSVKRQLNYYSIYTL